MIFAEVFTSIDVIEGITTCNTNESIIVRAIVGVSATISPSITSSVNVSFVSGNTYGPAAFSASASAPVLGLTFVAFFGAKAASRLVVPSAFWMKFTIGFLTVIVPRSRPPVASENSPALGTSTLSTLTTVFASGSSTCRPVIVCPLNQPRLIASAETVPWMRELTWPSRIELPVPVESSEGSSSTNSKARPRSEAMMTSTRLRTELLRGAGAAGLVVLSVAIFSSRGGVFRTESQDHLV